ncbi:MAG: FecCD family ABC transporter permease [Candidatus Saliniplasma sp.]
MIKERTGWLIAGLAVLLLITAIYSTTVGTADIPFKEVVLITLSEIPLINNYVTAPEGPSRTIVVLIRLPRIILGIIAGISLSVSGTSMQGIFKNPMASPFILGVSAGGGLGAAVGFYLGVSFIYLPLLAFLTAVTTVFLVFALGRVRKKTDVATLLLAGLAMNFLMSGLTSYIRYMSPPEKMVQMQILSFMLGNLNEAGWDQVHITLPIMIVGVALVFAYSRDLNVIQMGEESALQLGVNVERTKFVQLVTSSLLAAAMVAFTGIIGFVGLMIPHGARLIVGPEHKRLIPTAALMGCIFLILCDTIARMMGEIPVGIITVLLGSPFFIYLLIRNRGDTGW